MAQTIALNAEQIRNALAVYLAQYKPPDRNHANPHNIIKISKKVLSFTGVPVSITITLT